MRGRPLVLAIAIATGLGSALARAQKAEAPAPTPKIYDENADAQALVDAAVAKAARDHTRVLVMFGGNWCGWCHKLHDTLKKDPALAKTMRDEYQLVMVDTKAKNADAMMATYMVDQKAGVPYLVVLDGAGQVVTRQETGSLEEGDHHVPARVLALLEKNAAKAPAAKPTLEQALTKAKSEDKRVFLHFGAPWCGWCHKLDDYLARPEVAQIVNKEFIDLKIDTDRMEGGQDLLAKYCPKPGGIPWFVFLDADGKAIVTSDGPNGNVGYPLAPEEIADFMAMVKRAARKLNADDVAKLESALHSAAKEIQGARTLAPTTTD